MGHSLKKERAEIVKSGTWLYDGLRREVWIVRQNFEYHFEKGFDESERINDAGELFAVVYAENGNLIGGVPEYVTLDEAISAAERSIKQGIIWDDHRIQPLYGGRKYLLDPDAVQ